MLFILLENNYLRNIRKRFNKMQKSMKTRFKTQFHSRNIPLSYSKGKQDSGSIELLFQHLVSTTKNTQFQLLEFLAKFFIRCLMNIHNRRRNAIHQLCRLIITVVRPKENTKKKKLKISKIVYCIRLKFYSNKRFVLKKYRTLKSNKQTCTARETQR